MFDCVAAPVVWLPAPRQCAPGPEETRMTLLRPVLILCALLLPLAGTARAQSDVPNARDHPMLTRYPNSHITEYETAFNAVEFQVTVPGQRVAKKQRVEGDTTRIQYFHNDAGKQPSALQLIRNYQNAVKAIGGEVLYERLPRDSDSGETTLRVNVKAGAGGKEVWVRVAPDIFGAPTQSYRLDIVEVAAMQQVVSANQMLQELNQNGYIALYINFDTNKAELKPDGQATVREIVALLKAAGQLKVAIEGHTDNVGNAAANKTLSENRAKAVMAAVVAGGIPAARLAAAGYGAERPVADNRSEEGRAKNRRVELVKK
jgi:outer membrane protein OmpA-like peptidoglycan-associated protein